MRRVGGVGFGETVFENFSDFFMRDCGSVLVRVYFGSWGLFKVCRGLGGLLEELEA